MSSEHGDLVKIDKIKDAILDRNENSLSAAPRDAGIAVNRFCLVAHLMIDHRAHADLVLYHERIPAGARPAALTDGISSTKNVILARLLQTSQVISGSISNLFSEQHPCLSFIHPENGVLSTVAELKSLMTELKNRYDILKSNLLACGRNESGDILNQTALKFCHYNGRTCNYCKYIQNISFQYIQIVFLCYKKIVNH